MMTILQLIKAAENQWIETKKQLSQYNVNFSKAQLHLAKALQNS